MTVIVIESRLPSVVIGTFGLSRCAVGFAFLELQGDVAVTNLRFAAPSESADSKHYKNKLTKFVCFN
jgi:hypothetical protein